MSQLIFKFNEKDAKHIIININNISKCIEKIKDSLNNGTQIVCNVNMKKKNKVNENLNLIQMLSFELIIYKGIFFKFTPTTLTDIRNFNLILKLMWINPLIMKNFMKNKIQWSKYFKILKFLLIDCKFRTTKECIDLVLTITNLMIYSKIQHVKFLMDHDYGKAFCSFFRRVYLEQEKSSNALLLLINLTKIIWSICKWEDDTLIYLAQWMQDIRIILIKYCDICCWCNLNGRKKQKQCEIFHQRTRQLHDTLRELAISELQSMLQPFHINQVKNSNFFLLNRMLKLSKKNQTVSLKKCGNNKCKKKNVKLKICKKCQIITYCSKHCQKISWKNNHRKQCLIISL